MAAAAPNTATSASVAPKRVDSATAKIVLLGESSVGKSSIALRFARHEFQQNLETTIGAAFLSRSVAVPNGSVKYEIWDTAGQERYRSLAPIYYRGACGALVVYDITSSDTLKKAQTWIRELRANADPTLIIFLVGNKSDLESLRQVTTEQGRLLAEEEEGVCGFFESSAKDNVNIEELFAQLATTLLENGLASAGSGGAGAAGRSGKVGGVRTLEPPSAKARGQADQSSSSCC